MFDIMGAIHEAICLILISIASWFFNLYYFIIGHVASSDVVGGSFHNVFGNETVWNIVSSVHQTVVIPIAESILALFMLVQLIKISQRIDATATLPAVKDIVFLAVSYVLFHWLIVNSLGLLDAVYGVFNEITNSDALTGASIQLGNMTLETSGLDLKKASIGGCFILVITAFFSAGTGLIAYIVSIAVATARAIQLYVMAAFSPIPLALLGFEETRQSGISFLKNFCAACLAGAIMMFLFAAYPLILTSMTASLGVGDLNQLVNADSSVNVTGVVACLAGAIMMFLFAAYPLILTSMTASLGVGDLNQLVNADSSVNVTGVVDSALEYAFAPLLGLLMFIGLSILLIVGLVKAGSWAKEILGS